MNFDDFKKMLGKAMAMTRQQVRDQIELEKCIANAKKVFGKECFEKVMQHIEIHFMFTQEVRRDYLIEKLNEEMNFYLKHCKLSFE